MKDEGYFKAEISFKMSDWMKNLECEVVVELHFFIGPNSPSQEKWLITYSLLNQLQIVTVNFFVV